MNRLRFRDLPLFGKFLLPFLGLVVVLGTLGTFVVVRDLVKRAEAELDETLARNSLEARSLLRDRELYLVESASFSANLAGMATALEARDAEDATRLLRSVIALKSDLDLLVVADPDGQTFLAFTPREGGTEAVRLDLDWRGDVLVRDAIADPTGSKYAGSVTVDDRTYLSVAGAVCSDPQGCAPTGVAIVGIDVDRIVASLTDAGADDGRTVALYGADGRLVSAASTRIPNEVPERPASGLLRHTSTVGGVEIATLFADWEVRGEVIGTVGVAVPTAPAFAAVRGAGWRLALLVLAGMVGIVVLGALISRLTTSRVKELLETSRAIGRGEFSVRAPVVGRDELGELASGVNQMAEELEAGRETLELRVQQRTEEVERLMRERNEIFASLSHELRTPLATILLETEMMLDPSFRKNTQWIGETGETIQGSAQQLLALVNDILELVRAEAGSIDVALEVIDVHDVIDDLRPTIEALARSSELALTLAIDDPLPPVRADDRRLREVLLNLVDNAVKYTPAGGAVSIDVTADADRVRIAVTDTGVGMPQDAGERIFEPFYRVPGARTQRGQASSGLGLALSKRLIEAQGGTIAFTSQPEEGSTFVVTLPAVPEPVDGQGSATLASELDRGRAPAPSG
ncbi:MAG: sensor histidine kinase [Actinobacteria bacterium]|nr:sensor histidine kinase [Actinomycetota bacterium]